jgi:hypothetical protein
MSSNVWHRVAWLIFCCFPSAFFHFSVPIFHVFLRPFYSSGFLHTLLLLRFLFDFLILLVRLRPLILFEILCYKPEVRGFHSRLDHWIFQLTWSFQPRYGPGFDSASNRNEYQEYSWGLRATGWLVRPTTHRDLWADCLENVGASTPHNPMGLHGLLQE